MIRCSVIALLSLPVTAQTVIYDSGKTLPISAYVNAQTKPKKLPPENQQPIFSPLPVRTPSMQPGRIKPRNTGLPYLPLPLFIIGSDAFSKQWLRAHQAQLKALQAVGLLVNVETAQELKGIQAIAEGLWISPASGESVATALNLHHYPALISKTGIEQ